MKNKLKNQKDERKPSANSVTKKHRNFFIRLWLKTYRGAQQWNERRKTRNALSRLNAHQLKDIGLSEKDVKRDQDHSFWR